MPNTRHQCYQLLVLVISFLEFDVIDKTLKGKLTYLWKSLILYFNLAYFIHFIKSTWSVGNTLKSLLNCKSSYYSVWRTNKSGVVVVVIVTGLGRRVVGKLLGEWGKLFTWVSWLMLFFTDDGKSLNYIPQLCMHQNSVVRLWRSVCVF